MQNPTPLDDGLVLDVGAHLGEDSDFYLKLGYRVVAIEANPQLVERLAQRFAQEIAQGRLTIVPNAIGESDQLITFYINKKLSVWGTTDPKWAARNAGMGKDSEEIQVQCIRFEDVLARHGHPLYVKIDIEGADMLCVHALQRVSPAARPKFVSVESSKTSWRDLVEEFNTFERLGYTHYQVIDQRRHRNGRYRRHGGGDIEHRFESGATGPFGDNLSGPWLSKRQALIKYIPIFILYKTIGDNTFLPRVLRRLPLLRRTLDWVSWYDTHAMRA